MISDTWQSIRERIPFQSSLIIGFGLMAGAFVVFWSLAEEILEGEEKEPRFANSSNFSCSTHGDE